MDDQIANAMDPSEMTCINCSRLHVGACYNTARTCWICGSSGHIKRYCPQQAHSTTGSHREHHPGSFPWCHALGLDSDPDLMYNIRDTMNKYPGATIHLNDECIYRGVQSHYYRAHLPTGRTLADRISRSFESRITRRRSRSPSRDRRYTRTRSPLRRYGRDDDLISLSPTHSRHHQDDRARSLLFSSVSVRTNLVSPNSVTTTGEAVSGTTTSYASLSQLSLVELKITPASPVKESFVASQSRPALADRTNILDQHMPVARPAPSQSMNGSPSENLTISDPYFVLGVAKGASKEEIIEAYQSQLWELDLERMSDGDVSDMAADPRYTESYRILLAAKKQLIGR